MFRNEILRQMKILFKHINKICRFLILNYELKYLSYMCWCSGLTV